jgi:predicted ATPase/class 3 adenylate cyclase
MTLPKGTVTFLFTDIAGSTKLLKSLGEEYAGVLGDQRDLMRAVFQKWHGHEVDTQGDSFFVAFSKAIDAANAATEAQRAMNTHDWPEDARVSVRMALHTGEPEIGPTGYVGMDVHRAARISAVAHGGQILISATTEQLLREDVPAGASLIYQGEHRLKDLSRPDHLFELRVHGLPSDFPPLRSLDRKRTNLPVQSTSFVGRTGELEKIFELLSNPACRLLTLVGPGGIGKTRLALHAAAELSDDFSDGTYFVPLESIPSPEFIVTAVADGMNFTVDSTTLDGTAEDQLLGYLRGRSILLLIDNFEHVMDGVLFLSKLLENAPETKLFVTSRERLNLKSEWTFEVPGLGQDETESSVAAFELFMERARQIDVGFALQDGEEKYVRRICDLVEGLPLAIELAASWVRMYPPRTISEEIEGGIEFLSSSMRDLPTRHKSIQAVLDYSWKLLSDDERSSLMRLSVFQGGFTMSKAKDVADVSNVTMVDLVDKSLLRAGDDGRYEMHGLSRQYALSKLIDNSDEEKKVRERHAVAYADLLKEWEPLIKSGQRGEYLRSFGVEIGNVRVAWDWLINQKRQDLVLNALESLWLYYEIRNWFEEGFNKFKGAVAAFESIESGSGPTGTDAILAKLLTRQGWFAWRLGQYQQAEELAMKGLDLAIESVSIPDQAFSRLMLGIINYVQGDLGEAKGYLDESLDQWREIDDKWGIATTLFYSGQVTHTRGEFGEIDYPYKYGLELFKDAGYQFGATFSHTSVGRVVQTLGDFMKAKQLCVESLAIRREMEDSWGIAACLDSLGVLECGLGELDSAMMACMESLEIRRTLADRRGVATSLNNLAHVAYLREEFIEALRYCKEGLEIRRDLGNQRGIAASLHFLGTVNSALDDPLKAKEYLHESLKIREGLGDKAAISESLNGLGSLWLNLGNSDEAFEYFKQALKVSMEIGAIPLSLDAYYGLADCFLVVGEIEKGIELLSLVAHHRASSQEIKTRAQEVYQSFLEETQDPAVLEAWKQGVEIGIDEAAAKIMEVGF